MRMVGLAAPSAIRLHTPLGARPEQELRVPPEIGEVSALYLLRRSSVDQLEETSVRAGEGGLVEAGESASSHLGSTFNIRPWSNQRRGRSQVEACVRQVPTHKIGNIGQNS